MSTFVYHTEPTSKSACYALYIIDYRNCSELFDRESILPNRIAYLFPARFNWPADQSTSACLTRSIKPTVHTFILVRPISWLISEFFPGPPRRFLSTSSDQLTISPDPGAHWQPSKSQPPGLLRHFPVSKESMFFHFTRPASSLPI